MNKTNYITFKLWDGSISLHRDFVKSTTLTNLCDDISHIFDDVAYELINNNSILSNIGVYINQKLLKHNTDVLYLQRMPYYRYLVKRVLTFISDCYEYKIEEDECDALKRILFVEAQNNNRSIDSISYIIIPSLLRIICYKLEINEKVLFKHASSVDDLLLQTVKKYEKDCYSISGVQTTFDFDNILPISITFYFKNNYAGLKLPWSNYNHYFSAIKSLTKYTDYSLFYNLYHWNYLSFDYITKLRLNK